MPRLAIGFLHIRQAHLTCVVIRVFLVERLKTAPDVPFSVACRVSRPAASQNKKFNFVRWMTYFVQGFEAGRNLGKGVKSMLHSAPGSRLVG